MNKMQVRWPLFFAIAMVLGMWMGYRLSRNIPEGQGFFDRPRKSSVQEVIDLLNKKYVDSVASDSLTEVAIQSLLENLDPHTIYIPAAETAEANEDLQGNFEGIGVEFMILQDTVNAVSIIPEGPSEKAGLQVGDKFIKVNNNPVTGKSIDSDKIKKLLRGAGGSSVNVMVLRNQKLLSVNITRGMVPKPSVDASYMITPETGFIHLNKFSKTTYEEFMASLEGLKSKGMKELILDLRGNGGGLLDEAVDIADEFLDSTRLIVYTEGLHTPRQEYICKRPGEFEKGKLTLLIDEFSASASEVLAGALQDWDRATIIGRRSFGKGLVQEAFSLHNGAQLRLTVAKYYTPIGRNIQKSYKNGNTAYHDEILDRIHNGAAQTDSSYSQGKKFRTLLKNRIVYGGGGIKPDIIVSLDTTQRSASYHAFFKEQRISQFVYRYFVAHNDSFKNFKDAPSFVKGFKIDGLLWNELQQFAESFQVNIKQLSENERALLEQKIYAYLAMQCYRLQGYYVVENGYDEIIKEALNAKR